MIGTSTNIPRFANLTSGDEVKVAKSMFPVQPMPDGAIPYYLDEKEKTDEEV